MPIETAHVDADIFSFNAINVCVEDDDVGIAGVLQSHKEGRLPGGDPAPAFGASPIPKHKRWDSPAGERGQGVDPPVSAPQHVAVLRHGRKTRSDSSWRTQSVPAAVQAPQVARRDHGCAVGSSACQAAPAPLQARPGEQEQEPGEQEPPQPGEQELSEHEPPQPSHALVKEPSMPPVQVQSQFSLALHSISDDDIANLASSFASSLPANFEGWPRHMKLHLFSRILAMNTEYQGGAGPPIFPANHESG